jgi:hypothetical protein
MADFIEARRVGDSRTEEGAIPGTAQTCEFLADVRRHRFAYPLKCIADERRLPLENRKSHPQQIAPLLSAWAPGRLWWGEWHVGPPLG